MVYFSVNKIHSEGVIHRMPRQKFGNEINSLFLIKLFPFFTLFHVEKQVALQWLGSKSTLKKRGLYLSET